MRSEAFIQSVDEMLALNLSVDLTITICKIMTGRIHRNQKVEVVIRNALSDVLKLARRQLAEPRDGNMSFPEAMDLVKVGKMVTRPHWVILRTLVSNEVYGSDDPGDQDVMDFWLDNLSGSRSGSFSPYEPTDEDIAATDWMIYQQPIDINLTL